MRMKVKSKTKTIKILNEEVSRHEEDHREKFQEYANRLMKIIHEVSGNRYNVVLRIVADIREELRDCKDMMPAEEIWAARKAKRFLEQQFADELG